MQWTVQEQFLLAKTGRMEECEDCLVVNNNFAAVIDGATTKTRQPWSPIPGGRLAARILCDMVSALPPRIEAHDALALFTKALASLYERYGVVDLVARHPEERVSASIILASAYHAEIWAIGDCQALLCAEHNEQPEYIREKTEIDTIAIAARVAYLEAELLSGKTIEELLDHDTGRDVILPLLLHQCQFQNNTTPHTREYNYGVLDGFPVPDDEIRIYSLTDSPVPITTLVLASDGFPRLLPDLASSLGLLHATLREDPLMIHHYPATKGLQTGNQAPDDCAYVRLALDWTKDER